MRLMAALILACELASMAGAATFTVTTTVDGDDANPGDGLCATMGGECTLRAAIEEANAHDDLDTIELPAGQFIMTAGRPTIAKPLKIDGVQAIQPCEACGCPGSGTIVDAARTSWVFDVSASDVTIQNLTICGG